MNFEEALELLKQGKEIRKASWENKNFRLYISSFDNNTIYGKTDMRNALSFSPCMEDFNGSDWEEYNPKPKPVLTDDETLLLKLMVKCAYVKPITITKENFSDGAIVLGLSIGDGKCIYTHVMKDDWFKGLGLHYAYTLEELELDDKGE